MNDPVPSWQEGTGICFGSVTRDTECGYIETLWWSLLAMCELTCYCHLYERGERDSTTLPRREVHSVKEAKICRLAFHQKTLNCIFGPVKKAKSSLK